MPQVPFRLLFICYISMGCFLCYLFMGGNSVSSHPLALPELSPLIFINSRFYILLVIITHKIRPLWFSEPNIRGIHLLLVGVMVWESLSLPFHAQSVPPTCRQSCQSI